MSHEIRTPTNALQESASRLLISICLILKKTILQIRSSGEALVGIINDILDFSKIESGKLE